MIKYSLFNDKVQVGVSENHDGNMRFFDGGDKTEIIKNQKKLGETVGLSGEKIARIKTVYGGREKFTEYNEITKNNLPKYTIDNSEKETPTSDGLITRDSEAGILLPLADCLGAVVFDEKQKIVGLLHAGRQNIEQDGPKKFIEYFVNNFGSKTKDIKVWFSPYALGYCIFKLNNKGLGESAKEQFINAGILPENIIDFEIDTVKNDNFPSHSSGDVSKRFAIVVKMQ